MTPVNRRVFEEIAMVGTALFAIVWAVVRASVQAITLDEADTYFWFVATGDVWHPFPNNHVLNSALMWITTHVFGTSILTVRAPALLGGILYVSTCYFLCRSITDRFSLRLPLLLCLTYNPLILDFMVAARGYSLADGFLMAAIAVPVWHRAKGWPSLTASCAVASLALGLSFTANFSFAYVDLAAFLVVAAWAVKVAQREGKSIARVLGCCGLPGLWVAGLMCGYPLAHWPKGELWWGAHSFREMTKSLIDASLYRPNRRLGDGFLDVMSLAAPLLLGALGLLCVCQLVVSRVEAWWFREERNHWVGRFAAALAGIALLSLAMSWVAFRLAKLPLPMGRTGIYAVPFCTLIAGAMAAAPVRTRVSLWLQRGTTAGFICLACYFLLCMRLTYFKEYEWDADVKDVYAVLERLNHSYGVADIAANGFFVSPLNFYRLLDKNTTLPEFVASAPEPSGKPVYVLREYQWDVLRRENLVVIYRGKSTDVVIAVRAGGAIPASAVE
jgi:hypothetical protein